MDDHCRELTRLAPLLNDLTIHDDAVLKYNVACDALLWNDELPKHYILGNEYDAVVLVDVPHRIDPREGARGAAPILERG